MRLPRLLSFHSILLVVLLVSSPKIAFSDELDTALEELNTNELNTDVEEPAIELPESTQKRNPFRNVSQGVRKESRDKLVILAQQAVDTTARRMLSTEQHTPWQMMHALLGLRHDFQLLHKDQTVSGLDWICQGQTFDSEYWFEKTKFGGRAHPYNRPYAFEGHANQFLAILSMCGVELDQQFGTSSGPVTMRSMIEHTKMAIDLQKDEPTWTLWALSRYLPPDARWRNYKGEIWSIERLVQEQTARPMTGAPCGGTHSLFALAHARNVYLRQGNPLRGVWLQAEYKIRKYISTARSQQNSNGTLSSNYFRGRQYNPDFNKRMASAGHVLEFLMIALPQEELQARWVRRAIEATASDLMRNRKAYVKCSPLYHSVNALNIYLDRVNPRSAPIDTVDESPRTAMLTPRRIKETDKSLKRVPAMGISQTRELPPVTNDAEETIPLVKVPTTVAALPAVKTVPKSKTTSVPVLDRNRATTAIQRDREKWVSTAPERRGEIEVIEESENIKIIEPLMPTKVATVEDEAPAATDTLELLAIPKTTTTEAVMETAEETQPETLAETIPAAPTAEEPTAEEPVVEEPVTSEPVPETPIATEDKASTSEAQPETPEPETPVPAQSVSLPSTVEPVETAASDVTDPTTVELDSHATEAVAPFLSASLDTEDLVKRLEGSNREIAAQRSVIAAAAGIGQGQTVADVGAGTGLFLKLFSDAVGNSGQVFAIEISPRLVEHLDERVNAEQLQNVQVVRNSPRSLQLLNTRIDKAFLCDVYHEFEYPRDMLSSIFKALRPGGELVLIDYERDPKASREWILENVRANQPTFRAELETAGFEFVKGVNIPGLEEHYLMTFRRPQN